LLRVLVLLVLDVLDPHVCLSLLVVYREVAGGIDAEWQWLASDARPDGFAARVREEGVHFFEGEAWRVGLVDGFLWKLPFWKLRNLPFVSGTQKNDQMPMQIRMAPKKK
jgi:hypothetical protein